MIRRKANSYELLQGETIMNVLHWSMAGGGVRLITEITTDHQTERLMERFIEDCHAEHRTIIPLMLRAQIYFNAHPIHQDILKNLDEDFLRNHFI